jgi:predicted Zn-dependent protease
MSEANRVTTRALLGLAAFWGMTLAPWFLFAGDRQKAAEHYRQGNGLFDQYRFREAAAAYDRALQQDPTFAEALHNRALANEMVDRPKAIQDWRQFVELAGSREEFKFDVARAQARVQMLESMPQYPEAMHPSRYVPEAGDYYWSISKESEGGEWPRLPVKVFLGSAPRMKWQEGTREAYDNWSALFPLELVASPQQADIRVAWEESVQEKGRAGEMAEWVQFRVVGGELSGQKIAIITVDLRVPWTKDDMRAIISHEMGHALGIRGHSTSEKDIMFMGLQKKGYDIPVPIIPHPVFWRTLVKQPSQRDINTLIRLYNSAGPSLRLR